MIKIPITIEDREEILEGATSYLVDNVESETARGLFAWHRSSAGSIDKDIKFWSIIELRDMILVEARPYLHETYLSLKFGITQGENNV